MFLSLTSHTSSAQWPHMSSDCHMAITDKTASSQKISLNGTVVGGGQASLDSNCYKPLSWVFRLLGVLAQLCHRPFRASCLVRPLW